MSGLEQRAIHASFISTLANNINVPIWVGFLVNLGTISLLTFSDGTTNLAITVLVISVNVIAIIGLLGAIDDFEAWVKDQDAEASQTNGGQLNTKAPFGFYKLLTVSVFAALAISQLYMMHWA
jgi:uncharacterized membrane protein YkvI|tara:strand:+ start:102 stop:470 length:369 start_codon:yes stop_codon:yes gene_type:complete